MSWAIDSGKPPNTFIVDRILDENELLLDMIRRKLKQGKFEDASKFQEIVQRNLIYLMTLDPNNMSQKA